MGSRYELLVIYPVCSLLGFLITVDNNLLSVLENSVLFLLPLWNSDWMFAKIFIINSKFFFFRFFIFVALRNILGHFLCPIISFTNSLVSCAYPANNLILGYLILIFFLFLKDTFYFFSTSLIFYSTFYSSLLLKHIKHICFIFRVY